MHMRSLEAWMAYAPLNLTKYAQASLVVTSQIMGKEFSLFLEKHSLHQQIFRV